MNQLEISELRHIVEDYKNEIARKRQRANTPPVIINFRTDVADKKQREVFNVPIELLRFRKDNGRIASDVADYEKTHGPLADGDTESQKKLEEFLAEKDPIKSQELSLAIKSDGQRTAAIITCDGFLIDGNRRKMTMEKLRRENPGNPKFEYMQVVFLPSPEDEGGAPTILEIERLENKLQLQKDGKSEYYGFDRALSIKRKIDMGFSLEEQLLDDPQYKDLSPKELEKVVNKYHKEYLDPLACAERYLRQCGREGQYHLVSTGKSDPDGRWQAFEDYSSHLYSKLANTSTRIKLGVSEEEIGEIEAGAFNIIRLKNVKTGEKLHMIMRNLPKLIATDTGRELIKEIGSIDPDLKDHDNLAPDGEKLSTEELEKQWVKKNQETITWKLKKAKTAQEHTQEREKPLELLEDAFKKLTHEKMQLETVALADLKAVRDLASKIAREAKGIENEAMQIKKNAEEDAKSIGKKPLR